MPLNHVIIYPSDATACGTYRMIWPGNALANIGRPVTVVPRPPTIIADTTGKIYGINTGTADIVVFQRPGSYQIPLIIPLLQNQGKKVVIDMDDSLSLIHPKNPAYKTYDPRSNHRINWMHAAKACEMADLVTVTTPALAEEYGQHGRVEIIPNHIPQSFLRIPRPVNDKVVIGWAGYTATHVDDLIVTKGMINQVVAETNSKFVGFGDQKIFQDIGVRHRAPNELWSFTSIPEYPKRLVGFDIGLVPLQPSKFNEAKSWLKALEYAALGIVPIVSPTPDNMRLVELGAAVLAETPADWYKETKELVLDNDKRKELSEKCRQVAAQWTIEANAHKWWSAWEKVYDGAFV